MAAVISSGATWKWTDHKVSLFHCRLNRKATKYQESALLACRASCGLTQGVQTKRCQADPRRSSYEAKGPPITERAPSTYKRILRSPDSITIEELCSKTINVSIKPRMSSAMSVNGQAWRSGVVRWKQLRLIFFLPTVRVSSRTAFGTSITNGYCTESSGYCGMVFMRPLRSLPA